jgi:hypothetical protein
LFISPFIAYSAAAPLSSLSHEKPTSVSKI